MLSNWEEAKKYIFLKRHPGKGIFATHNEGSNETFKLENMFKSLVEDIHEEYPSDVIVKKLSIDLEKLDLKNITNKLNSMRRSFNTTDVQETVLKEFETRRLGSHGSAQDREKANILLIKTKIYDLMMQTIYMARHKINQVESEAYFNSKDTSYRIAFLYRRLRWLWKRLNDLYTTMVNNKHESRLYQKRFTRTDTYLTYHYKAAKLHVDFLYIWHVMMKLHDKYVYHHQLPNTYPPDD